MDFRFIDWELKIDALNKRRRERMRQSGKDDKSFALGTLAKWVPESADMPHFQQQAFVCSLYYLEVYVCNL